MKATIKQRTIVTPNDNHILATNTSVNSECCSIGLCVDFYSNKPHDLQTTISFPRENRECLYNQIRSNENKNPL